MPNPEALANIPTTIAPWLSVRDSARAIDFYKSAFAATEVFRLDAGDGVVIGGAGTRARARRG